MGVRKNIFACLSSIHNTISLDVINLHVINLLYYKNRRLFDFKGERKKFLENY